MKGTRRILATAILLVAGVALGAGILTMKRASGPKLAAAVSPPPLVAAAPALEPPAAPDKEAKAKAIATAVAAAHPLPSATAANPSKARTIKPAHASRPASSSPDGPAAAAMAGRVGAGGEGLGEENHREYSKAELAELSRVRVSDPIVPVLSPELRNIPAQPVVADPNIEVENRDLPTRHNRATGDAPTRPDGAIQQIPGPSLLTSTGVNFDGLPANGFAPPDNNGRVGPNHYVQWINVNFAIFDKSGTLLYGPSAGNSLFAALGPASPCVLHNDGDPLVVYDNLADRWILTQFAVQVGASLDSYQCTAVSVTGDPLGAYYLYAFPLGTNQFWDYPHHGVWPDAYYSTFHVFNGAGTAFLFQGLAAFERPAMLAGLPARVVPTPMDLTFTYFGALPADLDSLTPPPAGSPEYIFAPGSFEWDGTTALGSATLHVWTATTTWGGVPVTTLTGPTDMPGITVYNTDMCDFNRGCIPQPPGGTNLDAISGRLMNRVAYRNFGAFESIVLSDTVNTNPFTSPQALNNAAPRWYEIRLPGGVPTVFQQGTYAPDANHRWMGSVAMDNSGNIALGYSKSSAGVLPEIDVVGRLSSDPLGTLGTETVMQAGGGVQIGTANRWGDYTEMTVDPRDGCTFWYTNQYQPANGSFNWRTRIGAFRFGASECSPPAKGTLTGTVKDGLGVPIPGALVNLDNGFSGSTNSLGTYTIVLPPGAVNATASAPLRPGCTPSASTPATINNGAVTTKNFVLAGTAAFALGTSSIDDSGGNNNGVINRNECVKVNIPLNNVGCAVGTAISGVLSTTTPGVTVVQPNSGYPNVAAGSATGNTTPFQIATDPGFVCGTNIDLTLTVTSSAGVTPLLFSLPTCQMPISVNGSIAGGDPTQTGRLSRNGVSTTCAASHATPVNLDAVLRRYDAYTYTNTLGSPVCVTTQVTSGCGTNIFYVTYLGPFNPANIQTNYLADPGSSFAGTATWSFNVPAGATFTTVIHEVATTGCASYNMTISGLLDNNDGGRPAAPVAGNNGPICEGSTLNLTASTVGGATYSWTGPNGFTSSAQNPTIPSATPAASGTYTVVATIGTCASDPATTNVTVNPVPSAVITAPSVVCAESTTNVASVPDAGPGAAYVWTITNGVITSGAGFASITFSADPSAGPVVLGVGVSNAAGCFASGTASVAISATCGNFFTLTPCRLLDTRTTDTPSLVAGSSRTFILAGSCGIPSTAQAIVVNVAATGETSGGNLQIVPGGATPGITATINYNMAQTRSRGAVIRLGPGGTITVKCNQGAGSMDLVLDINGYFE